MGDPRGFLKVERKCAKSRPVHKRLKDFREVISLRSQAVTLEQASRCMDCGTPFCHDRCPLGNYIPEWNDFVFSGHWKKAFDLLEAGNNFPEFTGRLCPAHCEYACVLGINDDPITIRENELAIIEYAFKNGLVKAYPPARRTGKKIAVVGSGPAGLSCAAQLNKAGHKVVIFEKDDKIGGILRYGIPDFKLNKRIIDRRIEIMKKEGIKFFTNVNVGKDIRLTKIRREFNVVCLTGGSRTPRDLKIEGRELKGIHFAMDYLIQANKRAAGLIVPEEAIDAKGKQIVVIGGGDTGADCVGTAHRQGAAGVTQIEIMPKPPASRTQECPWPEYPALLKVSTSHQEGGKRQWLVLTKRFIGEEGRLKKIMCVKVDFRKDEGDSAKPKGRSRSGHIMKEVAGSEFEIKADLALLAIGFTHPEHNELLKNPKVELNKRGNVKTDENYITSVKGVFSAGDMRTGQSLIVEVIAEGRRSAHCIDKYLMGKTYLPAI